MSVLASCQFHLKSESLKDCLAGVSLVSLNFDDAFFHRTPNATALLEFFGEVPERRRRQRDAMDEGDRFTPTAFDSRRMRTTPSP